MGPSDADTAARSQRVSDELLVHATGAEGPLRTCVGRYGDINIWFTSPALFFLVHWTKHVKAATLSP